MSLRIDTIGAKVILFIVALFMFELGYDLMI